MEKYFKKSAWFIWLALVVVLPVSSMPLVARIIHSSAAAPASVLFLLILCLTWLPFYLWKKGTFPVQAKVALAFYFSGLISSALSFFLELPAFKNQQILSSVVSGVASLSLGILFYLITSILPNTNERIKSTLKALNWGGGIMLLWCISVWVISAVTPGDTPGYLRSIQNIFSTTTFFGNRMVGFASEPSWLAHILNMVYLPYWLSATISGFTALNKKWGKISIENVLLIFGVVVLFNTLSRAGLFAFLLVLGFFFIRLNIWAIRQLSTKWGVQHGKGLITLAVVAGFLIIYLGGATGMVYVLSKIDPRMRDVFSLQVISQGGFDKYANLLQFGERVTYWQAGWNIFNAHPVLGVGLGNAGYYFPQMLPDNAWQLAEVRRLVYHSTALMNIKSMWSRILAETGMVGFAFFLTLLVVTGFTARRMTQSNLPIRKTVGWMGICMLIAFLIEGFSVDSFALPYLWFTLGLTAAAWRWTKTGETGE